MANYEDIELFFEAKINETITKCKEIAKEYDESLLNQVKSCGKSLNVKAIEEKCLKDKEVLKMVKEMESLTKAHVNDPEQFEFIEIIQKVLNDKLTLFDSLGRRFVEKYNAAPVEVREAMGNRHLIRME